MRCFVMFVTAVCLLFLLKLKWPKNKSFYDSAYMITAKFSLTLTLEQLMRDGCNRRLLTKLVDLAK